MRNKYVLAAVVTCVVLQALLPETVYADDVSKTDFTKVSNEMNNIKAFATGKVLPFGGVIGTVYGAIQSYMRSSPWPLVIVGAIGIGISLILSLVNLSF